MAEFLAKEPDLTLAALKERLGLECTLSTIHTALGDMRLKYKKTLRASERDREDVARARTGWEGGNRS